MVFRMEKSSTMRKIVKLATLFAVGLPTCMAWAQTVTQFPNMPPHTTQDWRYARGYDADMVCGTTTAVGGVGYHVARRQVGASWDFQVFSYQISSAGVTSPSFVKSTSAIGWDFGVVSTVPYNTSNTNPGIFIVGGRTPGPGLSSAVLRFDGSIFTPLNPFGGGIGTPISGVTGVAVRSTQNSPTKILYFGGVNSSGTSSSTIEYDIDNDAYLAKSPMPVALTNTRALSFGANGAVTGVYLVGGGIAAAPTSNRHIYRYDLANNSWRQVMDSNGTALTIPGTKRIEVASVRGAMLLVTEAEDRQSFTVFRMTHPNDFNMNGFAKGATLTAVSRSNASRARAEFALLRCGPDTWIIGGQTGKVPFYQNRGLFVERLRRF